MTLLIPRFNRHPTACVQEEKEEETNSTIQLKSVVNEKSRKLCTKNADILHTIPISFVKKLIMHLLEMVYQQCCVYCIARVCAVHEANEKSWKKCCTKREKRNKEKKIKPDNYLYRCIWLTHFWNPQIYASRSLFYFITILVRQLFSFLRAGTSLHRIHRKKNEKKHIIWNTKKKR